jgi:hypothetical protein
MDNQKATGKRKAAKCMSATCGSTLQLGSGSIETLAKT